ncbi:septum formation initiator family protein [Anaerotignum lactatifermentans]|uniref:Septum formation initiator family protein n=2 Tax=Anaerotignum lactatifermentans TaxID=160404 RepID=A0ABS2GCY7_9FIRM|nr:septum formation initiator family protein [Anaerotignum lactatifermentans]MBM6878359.1 septum formation initiator family protein [Anaerotignum lactatifermentans]
MLPMERKGKTRRMDRLFIRAFLVVFVGAVGVGMYWQMQEYRALQREAAELEQQIAQEQERALDFEAQKEYYNSDSYIEQIAREKLGLVKSNEILYINRGE